MDICISSYSFHTAFENNQLTTLAFPAFCKRQYGVRKIEFFDSDFFVGPDSPPGIMDISPEHPYIQKIKKTCEDAGSVIVAISAQNDFTNPREESRQADIERVERWIQVAQALGVRVVRINSGEWFHSADNDGASRLVKALEELAPKAKAKGVTLAIENHPRDLKAVEEAEKLAEIAFQMENQNVSICPDNGHIEDAVWLECLDLLFTFAQHCHVKFYEFDTSGRETSLDYEKFFEVVHRNEYNGALSIELISQVNVPKSFVWFRITERTLQEAKKEGMSAQTVSKLELLKDQIFKTNAAFEQGLGDHLSREETLNYKRLIMRYAEKLDPDFEVQKELTCKAVQLLHRYGVKL